MSAPHPDCPGCQALQARVTQLEARLERLEARLRQNSRNSSRPPSADPPAAPKPPAKPAPVGRKPGGQPGHKGVSRCLKPIDQVDAVVALVPVCCARCATSLPPSPTPDDPPPRRHQVTDLPPTFLITTEYQLHARTCPLCARRTWAILPEGVSAASVGPRLQAFLALLVARFHLSRRQVSEWLADVGGERFSLGCLASLEAATATALLGPYQDTQAAVAQAAAVNVDETPWREGKAKAWLWLAATPALTLFRIDPCRSRGAFERLLPPEPSSPRTVTSDRHRAYTYLSQRSWQICWAHLLRDFEAVAEQEATRPLGEALLQSGRDLFDLWHAFRRGQIAREQLQAHARPVQARIGRLLRRARDSNHWCAAPLGRDLLRYWGSLWTFLSVAEVEPTNNAAERALRPAVLWRKRSFGHQGESGRVFVERLLTVVGSLRLQGRNVLAYLEAVCRAARRDEVGPSLLPGSEAVGAGGTLALAA
jgi:transposase